MGACSSSEAKYPVEDTCSQGLSQNDMKPLHTSSILNVCRLKDDELLTCSDDMTIVRYNWKTSDRTIYGGHEKSVNKLVAAADGTSFWSASRDLSIRQHQNFRMLANSQWPNFECERACQYISVSVTINQDGRNIASGSRDYSVRVYDITTGQLSHTYSAPRNIVTALEYNEAGSLLYQASEDLCVRVWDARQPKSSPSVHIKSFVYFPTCLKIAPSQHMFATGCKGFDGTGCEIKLFDLRMPSTVVAEYRGHQHDVTGVAFMSSYIASVSRDGTFRLWSCHASPMPHEVHVFQDKNYYTSLTRLGGDESCGLFAVGDMNGQLTIVSSDISAKDERSKTNVLHQTPASIDDEK